VLIKRDDINAAAFQARDAACSIGRMIDIDAMAFEATLDEPGKARIIIDIK
jgi:hypothetical protein